MTAIELAQFAHERCDQENLIAQLKGGVDALRMPVRDLNSNWAYMVMASLAWSLKAWFGLLFPNKSAGLKFSGWSIVDFSTRSSVSDGNESSDSLGTIAGCRNSSGLGNA